MFDFLKNKLKSALSVFSKKVEETPEQKEVAEPVKEEKVKEEKEVKKEKIAKKEKKEEKKERKEKKVVIQEEKIIVQKPEVEQKKVVLEEKKFVEEKVFQPEVRVSDETKNTQKPVHKNEESPCEGAERRLNSEILEEKKGFFSAITSAITTKKLSEQEFQDLFWDVELAMLENNVAVEVIEKLKVDLKNSLVGKAVSRTKVSSVVLQTVRESLQSLFVDSSFDVFALAKKHKPLVVAFVGINGSGKTTTIAKVAQLLKKSGLSVVLAAADTFRAAAIDQLQLHADALDCKLIRHDYGSDPAAVAFDAIEHAKAKNKDVVLIDTAGRLHSNTNLVDEMKKIIRVAKPHVKIFVGESITGNDCVEQARTFDAAIGIDGIILSKADIDDKGGAALSISYVTKKPILFLGVGQSYDDLQAFDKNKFLAQVGV